MLSSAPKIAPLNNGRLIWKSRNSLYFARQAEWWCGPGGTKSTKNHPRRSSGAHHLQTIVPGGPRGPKSSKNHPWRLLGAQDLQKIVPSGPRGHTIFKKSPHLQKIFPAALVAPNRQKITPGGSWGHKIFRKSPPAPPGNTPSSKNRFRRPSRSKIVKKIVPGGPRAPGDDFSKISGRGRCFEDF